MGLSPIPLHHRKKKPRPIATAVSPAKPYIVHESDGNVMASHSLNSMDGSGVPTQHGLNFHKLSDESKKKLELLLVKKKTGGGFVYVNS